MRKQPPVSRPRQPMQRLPQRYQQASQHNQGSYSGVHPEDAPYLSAQLAPEEEDEQFYITRPRSSIRTYQNTRGQQVIERGNQRIIVHQEPPQKPQKRRPHWLVLIGVGMVIAIFMVIGVVMVSNWFTSWQQDSAYGYPRTYQMDVAVGHGDSGYGR